MLHLEFYGGRSQSVVFVASFHSIDSVSIQILIQCVMAILDHNFVLNFNKSPNPIDPPRKQPLAQ